MKKILFFFFLLSLQMSVLAQDENNMIFGPVEIMPEYPGGQRALFQFLSDSIKYPPLSVQRGEEGRAIVSFIIDKDGSVDSVSVTRSSGYEALDREAVRVLNLMPNWSPGKVRGKLVRVRYTVPVNFSLPKDSEASKEKAPGIK